MRCPSGASSIGNCADSHFATSSTQDCRPPSAAGNSESPDRGLEHVGQPPRPVPDGPARLELGGQRRESARGHAERIEDPLPDVRRRTAGRRGARRSRRAAGRRCSNTSAARWAGCVVRDLGGSARFTVRRGLVDVVEPSRAGRIAHQARLVRQHPTERHGLDRPERALRLAELRQVRDGRVVQVQLPLVAQLQDRRRGERLRDRRDPEQRRARRAAASSRRRRSRDPPDHTSSSPTTTPARAPGRRCSFTNAATRSSNLPASVGRRRRRRPSDPLQIGDGLGEPVLEVGPRLPRERLGRDRDVQRDPPELPGRQRPVPRLLGRTR